MVATVSQEKEIPLHRLVFYFIILEMEIRIIYDSLLFEMRNKEIVIVMQNSESIKHTF